MNILATILFLGAAGFILFHLLGYPLLLAFLARTFPRPIRKRPVRPPVTVLMAVYNGEKWIEAKLRSILALDYPRGQMQIIVVSDASTDRTEEIARQFEPLGVELLRVPKGGKAAALNAGMQRATGEVLLFTDVRQPLDPACLRNLMDCLGDPEVGGATGYIAIREDNGEVHNSLYWRYEAWLREKLTRIDSSLVATGALYALRRELARPLPTNTLIDDGFLPLTCILQGYRFVFEPTAVCYEYSTALETEFRRKVRTLAGLYQLLRAQPAVFGPRNRLRFHLFFYKVGRLLLPFALLLAAASSLALSGTWGRAAILAQAVFYGAALADPLLPRGPWKRITAVVHTFVVLMAASLCAVSVFFVPPERLWKETKVQATAPPS